MSRRLLRTLALLASLPLAACVAGGDPAFVGDPVLLDASLPGTARVTVMRASQFSGSGKTLPLELDGALIAHLGTGDCVQFYVGGGEHFLLAGDGQDPRSQLQSFVAKPGEHVFFRFEEFPLASDRKWRFDRLAPEPGAREFANGDYALLRQAPVR
jgi:hypothetical protein